MSTDDDSRQRDTGVTRVSPTAKPPPRDERLGIGVVVGERYRLDQSIGSGGMGQVFRGLHLTLQLPIAVKVLHSFYGSGDSVARRFRREARAASLLRHPNVVQVLDYASHGDQLYLVMEYIEGPSLKAWLKSLVAPPTLADVADILGQILDALEAAHASGVVHRDLKPDNVILAQSPTGQRVCKVVDFGLAHLDDDTDAGPTLTRPDAVAGTPAYMSPEQCRSLKVGPSTDIYAIGCILTELLQLEPPFRGESTMDVISQQMFAEPPPLQRPTDAEPVPVLLERLRLELLAKLPHARPASISEIRDRLKEAVDPRAHLARLPDRKGETPGGSRSQRAPGWIGADSHASSAAHAVEVTLVEVAALDADSSRALATGLRALGVVVERVSSIDRLPPDADLVVLDMSSDRAGARAALVAARERAAGCRVVLCLDGLRADELSPLIAMGAADVLRSSASPELLLRKLTRLSRRKSCG